MTFIISVTGHDDLTGDEKEALENSLVEEAQSLIESFASKNGCNITNATINTNTSGQVNLLDKLLDV